jgi:hypothetical protein
MSASSNSAALDNIPCETSSHRKPRQVYEIIERCSGGPFLELFARELRRGWTQWGDEVPTNGDLTKLHALPFVLPIDEEPARSYFEQRVLMGIR